LGLRRKGINFKNLALRFLGDWQKGIEYIGKEKKFAREFSINAAITQKLGGYKLSLLLGGKDNQNTFLKIEFIKYYFIMKKITIRKFIITLRGI